MKGIPGGTRKCGGQRCDEAPDGDVGIAGGGGKEGAGRPGGAEDDDPPVV